MMPSNFTSTRSFLGGASSMIHHYQKRKNAELPDGVELTAWPDQSFIWVLLVGFLYAHKPSAGLGNVQFVQRS